MCFRPAELDTAGPVACPNCGKMVRPVSGLYPKKCPFCKISIEELQATMAPPARAPMASGAPVPSVAPKPPAPPKPPIAQ